MDHTETVHGFRATFKTWANEATSYQNEVIELALAHAIGTKVEKAYQRGDLFIKRVRLMQDWADYCSHVHTPAAVVQLRKTA